MGLRTPITTLPHGIWSPSVVNRMPYGPSSCSLRSREVDLVTGLRMEQVMNRMLMATEDAKEGPAAFAEKRAPQWKGR